VIAAAVVFQDVLPFSFGLVSLAEGVTQGHWAQIYFFVR